MDELIERIEKMSEELRDFRVLLEKYGDIGIASDVLMHKKIEDGIIKNFHIANDFQLKHMRDKYNFKYYDKEIMVKVIDAQIIKNKRRDKMIEINKQTK